MQVSVTGSIVKDQWNGSANITKSFASARKSLLISNDGASDLTFTVNGMTFTVKPTEVFDESFDPFTSVTITTTSAYRAWARG